MSNEDRIPTMDTLKTLSDEDKRFVMGYAAGVMSVKQSEKPKEEAEAKEDGKSA